MHRFPALLDAMDYGQLYERQVYRKMLPESI